jgi:hypothetical protein
MKKSIEIQIFSQQIVKLAKCFNTNYNKPKEKYL